MKYFKERLEKRAAELGYSAPAIADKLNMSRSTVWQWFSGKSLPRAKTLKKLAECLNVSVSWLSGKKQLDDIDSISLNQLQKLATSVSEPKINKFKNPQLAQEVMQIMLDIENSRQDLLAREVRCYLNFLHI
jgi:transcriptional regulator with XRE-family HTH domain